MGKLGGLRTAFEPTAGSHCLVTYRPEELCPEVLAAADVLLSVSPPVDQLLGGQDLPAGGRPKAVAGQATVVRADVGAAPQSFTVAQRHTTHLRHEHKYSRGLMPSGKGFHFRDDRSQPLHLPEARSVEQFRADLEQVDPEVFAFHLGHGDFARWLGESVQDRKLADLASRLQRETAARRESELNRARAELANAISERYPDREPDDGAPPEPEPLPWKVVATAGSTPMREE